MDKSQNIEPDRIFCDQLNKSEYTLSSIEITAIIAIKFSEFVTYVPQSKWIS